MIELSFETLPDGICSSVFIVLILAIACFFIKLMVSLLSDEPKKTKDIDVKFDKMFSPIVYIFFVNSMILATQLSLKPELAPNRDLHRFSEIGVINGFQILGYHLALVLLIINICSFAIYFWKTEVSLNRDVK